MKKLIPTISMALLSAAMLGTSTYAWFSANKTVSASGISMTAKADGSLLITATKGSGWAATASMTNDNSMNSTINPITPIMTTGTTPIYDMDSTTGVLKYEMLTQKGMEQVSDGGSFVDPSDISTNRSAYWTTTDVTKNYFKDTVWVKYNGSDEKNLTVAAQITTTAAESVRDTIWQAMKVITIVKKETSSVYSIDKHNKVEFSDLAKDADGGTVQAIKNGDVVEIDVYAYVEGKDSNCYNAAAINGSLFNIGLSFTAADK